MAVNVAMFEAVDNNDAAAVRELLASDIASARAFNGSGRSALHESCDGIKDVNRRVREEISLLLIEAKADVSAKVCAYDHGDEAQWIRERRTCVG